MAVTRTGQFFLLGALLLATILGGTIVLTQDNGVTSPATGRVKAIFDQATAEFPRAVNIGVDDTATPHRLERTLTAYMEAQSRSFARHGLQDRAHALLVVPRNDSAVTVLITNVRGRPLQSVHLTVDGDTTALGTLADGRTAVHTAFTTTRPVPVSAAFRADRRFTHNLTAPGTRTTALYRLSLAGESQTWENTLVY